MDLETKAQGDFFEPDEHDREAVDEQKSEIRGGDKIWTAKKMRITPLAFPRDVPYRAMGGSSISIYVVHTCYSAGIIQEPTAY